MYCSKHGEQAALPTNGGRVYCPRCIAKGTERHPSTMDEPGSYAHILKVEGPWFRIAFRYAIRTYACLGCKFALATHGGYDAVFGVGAPLMCADCVKTEKDVDWRPVDPKVYDKDTQAVITVLGDLWLVPRVP